MDGKRWAWSDCVELAALPAPRLERELRAAAAAGGLPAPVEALRGVPQDPRWHPEGDVLEHSIRACEQAARAADREQPDAESRRVAVIGALLHDVGKASTTVRGEDGRIRSHDHAPVGAAIARDALLAAGAPPAIVDRIEAVVREHMAMAGAGPGAPSPRAVRRLVRRLAPASFADWSRVCAADRLGRGGTRGLGDLPAWIAVHDAVVAREQAEGPRAGEPAGPADPTG